MTASLTASETDARLTWAAITGPFDETASALTASLGHEESLRVVRESADRGDLVTTVSDVVGHKPAASTLASWAQALSRVNVLGIRREAERAGMAIVDPTTVPGISDLGARAPHILFVVGQLDTLAVGMRVAIVGARAATSEGLKVTFDLSADLASEGASIISGGAYGVDADAHRGALYGRGRTVAFLAGGLDRLYPSGNAELLERIGREGALVSERVPGAAPNRLAFLARNRLIAAHAGVTVVTQAASRSGSMNTAGHAAEIGRPVATVAWKTATAHSAGPDILLAERGAHRISTAASVLALLQSQARS